MLMFGIKAAVFACLAVLYNVAIGVWLSLVERLVRVQITDYERKNSKTAENP